MAKSGKTKKALTKRFKITANRKMMHRPTGQNHFSAKESGNKTRAKRSSSSFIFLPKTLKSTIVN